MTMNNTFKQMRELLNNISHDLVKSENGNKAASQRVRTGTVRLEKLAKQYRKESISFEKKNKGQKRPGRSVTGSAKSKSASGHQNQASNSRSKSASSTSKQAGSAHKV